MKDKNMGISPSEEIPEFNQNSELSKSIAIYIDFARSRGLSYPSLVNEYCNGTQSEKILKVINDFESAHAFLLIGAKLKIFYSGGNDA